MLSAGRSVRLAVPERLSVIGFDNTTMAQSEFVGLSTVDYPRQEVGERVLSLLQDRITDPDAAPREIRLAPRLITRTTTAPPAAV
jgi:DNA-binding LacI/PurR family transcriptional regulator